MRVTVTDPQGAPRTQQWEYDPDHLEADVACSRCEVASEQVDLLEMAGRPNAG